MLFACIPSERNRSAANVTFIIDHRGELIEEFVISGIDSANRIVPLLAVNAIVDCWNCTPVEFRRVTVNQQPMDFWQPYGVPLDEPACGYSGEWCSKIVQNTVIAAVVALFVAIVGVYVLHRYRLRKQLASMVWRLDPDKLMIDTAVSYFCSRIAQQRIFSA